MEVPLAHFLDDAVEVRRAALASDRIVQVGAPRRSDPRVLAAAAMLRSGALGKVLAVELSWKADDPGLWRREEEVAGLKEADTDWKRFLLHLPSEPFDARKELEFRLFWPFSSGIPDQWLSQLIDLVPLATGDPFPRTCLATGALRFLRDGRRNPDVFTAVFDYPSGFQAVFEARLRGPGAGIREAYTAERGVVDLRAGTAARDGGAPEPIPAPAGAPAAPASPIAEFLDCLRSRRPPVSDIRSGFSHAVAVCMAVQSYLSGKRIGYDAIGEKLIAF